MRTKIKKGNYQMFFKNHFMQIVAVLLVSVMLAACGGGERESRNRSADEQPVAQQSAQRSSEGNEAGATVNVVARDFEFILDANSAAAGTVSFAVTNEGSMPHDFAITIDGERYKTEMIPAGSSASLTVDLPPGTYEYICTVPGHDILGMKGTFTVN
jgi:plastocyanin